MGNDHQNVESIQLCIHTGTDGNLVSGRHHRTVRHRTGHPPGHHAAFPHQTLPVVRTVLCLGSQGNTNPSAALFFWIFLPRATGIKIPDSTCIIIALIVNASSYVSEIIRAGIQAVDIGQTEAARSLGMTARNTMTKIILPQAVKNILPALGNEFITMIKQASLASVFFINELTTSYKTVASATFRQVESIIIAGIIYLLVTTILGRIMAYAEWRMKQNER